MTVEYYGLYESLDSTSTDAGGNFGPVDQKTGSRSFLFSKAGYISQTQNIWVPPYTEVNLGVSLGAYGGSYTTGTGDTGGAGASGTLSGYVKDTGGSAIEFAAVSLVPSNTGPDTTDGSGYYILSKVPVDQYQVIAGAAGYQSAQQGPIGMQDGADIQLDFILTPESGPVEGSGTLPVTPSELYENPRIFIRYPGGNQYGRLMATADLHAAISTVPINKLYLQDTTPTFRIQVISDQYPMALQVQQDPATDDLVTILMPTGAVGNQYQWGEPLESEVGKRLTSYALYEHNYDIAIGTGFAPYDGLSPYTPDVVYRLGVRAVNSLNSLDSSRGITEIQFAFYTPSTSLARGDIYSMKTKVTELE